MIKLLPLLLVFSLAYGQNVNYLLPDQNALFIHTLEGAFKHSRERIFVITKSFHHPALKRALLEGTKRGSRLTLLVQTPKDDPLELAQYERIEIRILKGRPLEGSVIIVDDHYACTLPQNIDEESFSGRTALVRCSDDTSELAALRSALLPLINRSNPYLE